ncbi:MAG: thiolase family protein [Patescibacteria group bacterium]
MEQKRVVIAASCRTPMGKMGGNLKDVTAQQLLSTVFRGTLKRAKFNKEKIEHLDEVIAGNVAQSSDAPNVTRVAALLTNIPVKVPAYTVQRNCGSGLQALVSAAQMIKAGEAEMILVGGTENMSRIPYVNRDLRFGKKFQNSTMVDALWEGLTDPITGEIMGLTAENIAEECNIGRKEQDDFAVRSHEKANEAITKGLFDSQIVPVDVKGKNIGEDEGANPTIGSIIRAMPDKAFFKKGGTVHAWNSCPISDGASSFLVLTLEKAQELGIEPEAEIVSYAFAGLEPRIMGMGPAYAIPKALQKANLGIGQIDFWEINEAFASQTLACQHKLGIRLEQLNVWGGAIALGHPVGATGAILTTKLIYILKNADKNYGVVSMCIGGGQGGALVIKNWRKE